MDQKRLADKIAADILKTPQTRKLIPRCWACDREFSPRPNTGDDNTAMFCSKNCIEAYDAGCPRNADAPTASDFFYVDFSRWRQVAGPPIPKCEVCGDLCVERFRSTSNGTGNFCSWRCRDGKPKDCIVCGKPLYALPRRGPFCSDSCAQNRKARKARNAAE